MAASKYENTIIRWSGFFKKEEEADAVLIEKTRILSDKNNIISSEKKATDRVILGLTLYNFCIKVE